MDRYVLITDKSVKWYCQQKPPMTLEKLGNSDLVERRDFITEDEFKKNSEKFYKFKKDQKKEIFIIINVFYGSLEREIFSSIRSLKND